MEDLRHRFARLDRGSNSQVLSGRNYLGHDAGVKKNIRNGELEDKTNDWTCSKRIPEASNSGRNGRMRTVRTKRNFKSWSLLQHEITAKPSLRAIASLLSYFSPLALGWYPPNRINMIKHQGISEFCLRIAPILHNLHQQPSAPLAPMVGHTKSFRRTGSDRFQASGAHLTADHMTSTGSSPQPAAPSTAWSMVLVASTSLTWRLEKNCRSSLESSAQCRQPCSCAAGHFHDTNAGDLVHKPRDEWSIWSTVESPLQRSWPFMTLWSLLISLLISFALPSKCVEKLFGSARLALWTWIPGESIVEGFNNCIQLSIGIVHWCPLMSIDVHWHSICVTFLPVITDVLEGWSNQWISSEVVYPFLQGNSVCIVVQASWENQESETAKWSKWHRSNHPQSALSCQQVSTCLNKWLHCVDISEDRHCSRTSKVDSIRTYGPEASCKRRPWHLSTRTSCQLSWFHMRYMRVIRKKTRQASLISWFISCWGSFCLFLFPYDFIEFPREFLQNVPQVRPGRSLRRAVFSASPAPHRAVQPRLRWIPHLISLGESYEKFIRTWENMWNCMKMS